MSNNTTSNLLKDYLYVEINIKTRDVVDSYQDTFIADTLLKKVNQLGLEGKTYKSVTNLNSYNGLNYKIYFEDTLELNTPSSE